MMRINLLPIKKARKQQAGQKHLAVMVASVVVSVFAVALFHMGAAKELEELQASTNQLRSEIEKLKSELGDYEKIRAQRDDMLKQRKTIESLQLARTGPVNVLRELSEILSPNKGPTFDRVDYEATLRRDPNSGFNSTWDTRRVWVDLYDEEARNVRIKAFAKSSEDAFEFIKRLRTSVFFSNVMWLGNTAASGAIEHVGFDVTAKAIY